MLELVNAGTNTKYQSPTAARPVLVTSSLHCPPLPQKLQAGSVDFSAGQNTHQQVQNLLGRRGGHVVVRDRVGNLVLLRRRLHRGPERPAPDAGRQDIGHSDRETRSQH